MIQSTKDFFDHKFYWKPNGFIQLNHFDLEKTWDPVHLKIFLHISKPKAFSEVVINPHLQWKLSAIIHHRSANVLYFNYQNQSWHWLSALQRKPSQLPELLCAQSCLKVLQGHSQLGATTSHHPWISPSATFSNNLWALPWHSGGWTGPRASQTQLWVEQSHSWNRQTSLAVLRNKKKRSLRMKPAILEEPAGSHVSHMPSYVCSGGVLQLLLFHSSLFKENVTRPQGLTNICWHFFWVSLRRPARI